MSNCQKYMKGNLLSTDDEEMELFGVGRETRSLKSFCSNKEHFVLFNDVSMAESVTSVCKRAGGKPYIPSTEELNNELFLMIKHPLQSCHNVDFAWLGVYERSGVWHMLDDDSVVQTTYFGETQPSNTSYKRCAVMHKKTSKWHGRNCSEIRKGCSPCTFPNDKALILRGMCFKIEEETFVDVRSHPNNALFYGHHGILIHSAGTLQEWQMFDANKQTVVASVSLTPKESTPIGRHNWKVSSKVCDHPPQSEVSITLSSCRGSFFTCDNAECIPRDKICDSVSDCLDLSDEALCEIVKIPVGYERNQPPKSEGLTIEALVLTANVEILRLLEIDDVGNQIQVEFKIELRWRDGRLSYYNLQSNMESNRISDEQMASLWVPKLYFPTTYNGQIFKINENVRVLRDGLRLPDDFNDDRVNSVYEGSSGVVVLGQHYSGQFACDFYVSRYPFDHHRCRLLFGLNFTPQSLVTFSNDSLRLQYFGKRHIGEFQLDNITAGVTTFAKDSTKYSALQVEVALQRLPSVVMVTVFMPTCQLLIISYATLFIRVSLLQVRLPATLSTMLVLYTLFQLTAEQLPKTSYVKMVDVWFLAVSVLVSIIVVAHILIEYLSRCEKERVTAMNGLNKHNLVGVKRQQHERRTLSNVSGGESASEIVLTKVRLFVVPSLFVVFNIVFWYSWFI